MTKYNQLTKCAEQICRVLVLENGIYTAGEFHLTDTVALNTYTMSFNIVLQNTIKLDYYKTSLSKTFSTSMVRI